MSRTLFGLVFVVLSAGPTRAEPEPLPDAISTAYFSAMKALRDGEDRQKIAETLGAVLDKNATLKSPYMALATSFHKDLAASAKNPPPADAPPEKRLAESGFEFSLVYHGANGSESLSAALKKLPKDPVAELLAADRKVIERLLPALRDRSPTRCAESAARVSGWRPPQPRACDLALAIIEFHSKCQFHHDTIQGTRLHQLPEKEFDERVTAVEAWWKENKDKSVAAGIRAYLPKAASYPELATMAKNLIRESGGPKTDDGKFAVSALLAEIKRNPRTHVAAYHANVLAEFGDTSALDYFYDEWKAHVGRSAIYFDARITFYFMKYGQRREWELLHAIAVGEQEQGGTTAVKGVLGTVVRNNNKRPYMVPMLALALTEQHTDGVYHVSLAEQAMPAFQTLTKQDFGFSASGTADEKQAAIRRAKTWWKDEGAAKHSFAVIEKETAKKP